MEFRIGQIPSGLSFVCAILSIAVPYAVHKINKLLHDIGDPAWKKK